MAAEPVSDRRAMLAGMDPWLDPVRYRFIEVTPGNAGQVLGAALATFREEEGVCAIAPDTLAEQLGAPEPILARIVLRVHSALDGVGLTAAVSGALADAGIACNVVAALRHDHLFVPSSKAEKALAILSTLSKDVRRSQ